MPHVYLKKALSGREKKWWGVGAEENKKNMMREKNQKACRKKQKKKLGQLYIPLPFSHRNLIHFV